jgi:hypothetical protein
MIFRGDSMAAQWPRNGRLHANRGAASYGATRNACADLSVPFLAFLPTRPRFAQSQSFHLRKTQTAV